MRNPHIAIMRASARGKGVHLTADEVCALTEDDAIVARAAHWLTAAERQSFENWATINAHRIERGE